MTTYVAATANAHKLEEMRAVLTPLGVTIDPRPAGLPEVDEDADTLEENASHKALTIARRAGRPAIADDTGLFVAALGGRPGVRSARYAGESASDADNVAKLLVELRGVASGNRGAYFRTVIAVAQPTGEVLLVDGVLDGAIALAPRGVGGFGYDPVFLLPAPDGRTLGELSPEEKNALSHRGRALRALGDALRAPSGESV